LVNDGFGSIAADLEQRVYGKELAEALAKKTDTSNASADRTIAAFIEIISGALKKGDKVALVGFGTFED
jgi:nucleoid DNA-binding protein